jgi:8-amino-7-oxononanoate synthase
MAARLGGCVGGLVRGWDMDGDVPTLGPALGSIETYSRRRVQLAGGSLLSDDSFDCDLIDYLKTLYLRPLDTLIAEFERTGRRLVSFANYDYAALADEPRIKSAACDAIMNIGLGAGASRLVGGERAIHNDLERDLARFLGVDDAIALVSGYMTNVSLLGHFLTKSDLILVDELSHNSVIVGTDISRARVIRFAHNNLDHLESILTQVRGEANRALIIVEGLYSMDGDVANLPRLLEIKERYNAWLMVDEAHCLGVLGATGRGSSEHFGIDPKRIDIIVGTMSKTLGACGGFIAGSTSLIDWLRFSLPAFVFSVGMSPALAAAVREAINILNTEPWRVAKLQENSQKFLERAKRRGLNTGPAIGTGVVSVIFANQRECMYASQSLLEAGYFAPPILQLAVPKDEPRIRFFISAKHSDEQISGVIDTLAAAMQNLQALDSHRRWPRRPAKIRPEASIAADQRQHARSKAI